MGRRGWVVAGAVVLAGVIAWPVTAAVASDQVQVYSDAAPLLCSHEPTTTIEDGDGDFVVAAVLRDDLSCELRVHVRNDSAFAMEITRVWLPFMGAGSGFPVHAPVVDRIRPTVSDPLSMDPRENSRDALVVYENPLLLEPGESHLIVARVSTKNDGCASGEGSFTIYGDQIVVTTRILGISADAPSRAAPFAFANTETVGDCS